MEAIQCWWKSNYEAWWRISLVHGQKTNFGGSRRLTWGTRTPPPHHTHLFYRWCILLLAASDMVTFGLPQLPPCSVKSGLEAEANMEAGVQVRWVWKEEGRRVTQGNNWVGRLWHVVLKGVTALRRSRTESRSNASKTVLLAVPPPSL